LIVCRCGDFRRALCINSGSQRQFFGSDPLFVSFSTGGTPMLEGLFQPMHLMIIAGIALLIFGPKKLPELGKGLGEGLRGFKAAMAGKEEAPVLKAPASTPEQKA
jgi:sec-independent protein translocase protein TatA